MAGELGFEPRFSESESDVLPLNYSPKFPTSFHIDSISVLQSREAKFYKLGCVLFSFRVGSTRESLAVDMLGVAHKLANEGVDTRTIQGYLGHKSIQHTMRYTELAPTRFKGLWRD